MLEVVTLQIRIHKDEARIFKEHSENNILRPEVIGNFYVPGFFVISKAYVIDDATGKKYDFTVDCVDMGNGIVHDYHEKLFWLKNANYLKKETSWKYAKNECEELIFAGYSDWRLPSRDELKRMYAVINNEQEANVFLNLSDNFYWTSIVKCHRQSSYPYGCVSLKENKYTCCSSSEKAIMWPVHSYFRLKLS